MSRSVAKSMISSLISSSSSRDRSKKLVLLNVGIDALLKSRIPSFNDLSPFHRHRHRIPSAETQCRYPSMDIAADHFVDERDQHTCAAGADGMSDGYCPSIYVYFGRIEAEFLHHSQCLHRKSLV